MKRIKERTIFAPLFWMIFILFLSLSSNIQAQLAGKTSPNQATSPENLDLTDQARWESETYIHEGLSQRTMLEECAKLKDPKACNGKGKTKFLGVDSGVVQAVSRVYSLFGGMMAMAGSGGFKVASEGAGAAANAATETGANAAAKAGPEGAEQAAEKAEDQPDYCAFIPTVGEVTAMFMQQTEQSQINSQAQTKETAQIEQLYKAARAHNANAKAAQIQGVVWGSTAACYSFYMAFGGIVIDWAVIAKTAGAGFLSLFWLNEANQQKKYAKEVKRIADNLPGRGDCNPHTENQCYCAQIETMYDPQYCLPQLHAKAIAATSYRVPCTGADMNVDAKCDCLSADACFDSKFFSELTAPGFAQFASSAAGSDFRNLTRGSLSGGKLASGLSSQAARSKKLIGDLTSKIPGDPNTLPIDSLSEKTFNDLEVPGPLAKILSAQPINPTGSSKVASLGINSQNSKLNLKDFKDKGSEKGRVLSFSGGHGSFNKANKKSDDNLLSQMLNKYQKNGKGKRGPAGKTLRFAEKATNQAQISNNKSRHLFDIISRRYQVSGFQRLELQ